MKNLTILENELRIEMRIGRASGYGQYNIQAEVRGDFKKDFNFHTTDSEIFDLRSDDEVSYEDYQEILFKKVESKLMEQIADFINNSEDNN